MLAGHDANGPQLYQIDPSGTFFAWKASAIGKNMVNAKTFLEKRYADDLELEDAIDTALLTLKESFEGEMSGANIEVRMHAADQATTKLGWGVACLRIWCQCLTSCHEWPQRLSSCPVVGLLCILCNTYCLVLKAYLSEGSLVLAVASLQLISPQGCGGSCSTSHFYFFGCKTKRGGAAAGRDRWA